jgi:hypothetical protein
MQLFVCNKITFQLHTLLLALSRAGCFLLCVGTVVTFVAASIMNVARGWKQTRCVCVCVSEGEFECEIKVMCIVLGD